MHDNHVAELTPSNVVDERKAEIYKMVEQINIRAATATEFLDMLGDKMLEIEMNSDDKEINELCKLKAIAVKQNDENKESSALDVFEKSDDDDHTD